MTATAVDRPELRTGATIGVRTMLGVLAGRREAILRAAGSGATLRVGAVLVLAAGLARDYDTNDLLHEPWWLAVPFAVSGVLAGMFYLLGRLRARGGPGWWAGYRSLVGVMWLMAPMALLYGVPWERMVSARAGVDANLWTLGVVSAWRVGLMVRVLSVLTGRGWWGSFFIVMLVVGPAALAGLILVPKPMLDVMGGLRLTDAERQIAGIAFLGTALAMVTMPVWLIGGLASLSVPAGVWAGEVPVGGRVSRGLRWTAAGCVAVWVAVLPVTQREQGLRWRAERMMAAGEVDAALAVMTGHRGDEFPPAWDPPPRVGWSTEERPKLLDVVERVEARKVEGWTREAYLEKFERWYLQSRHWDREALWGRVEGLLARLPEGPAMVERNREDLERLQRYAATEAGLSRTTTTGPATAPAGNGDGGAQ